MMWFLRRADLFSRGHHQPMAPIYPCLASRQVPDHGPCDVEGATGVWVLSVVMGM